MERRILKTIFARISDLKRDFNGFPDPTIYCSGLRIHLFCGPGSWTVRVIEIFCLDFRFRAKMEGRIWLINHNGLADLHTPIHPPPRV